MHNTRSSGEKELFKPGASRLETKAETTSILVTIINVRVAKTKACFLASENTDI